MLTHDEFACHCLLQTWWYPGRSNLVLIWDSGELLSMSLRDSSHPITIVIVRVMMAIRWLKAHLKENNRQEMPWTIDKKIWNRRRLMTWVRAKLTSWLYEYVKKHMSKHGQCVQCVSAGHCSRCFQASFCNSSECSD